MRPTLVFLFTLLSLIAGARADVAMSIDVGWDNHYRFGRWSPIFVTVSSDTPRQVEIDLYCPTDRRYAMSIGQSIVISPTAVTVPLYVPLSEALDETRI